MKKYAILFLAGVMLMTTMVSCKPSASDYTINPKSQTELSDAEQKKIKQDFVVWWNENNPSWPVTYDGVLLDHYYGTYNGAVALFIDPSDAMYSTVEVTQIVAGYEFYFSSGRGMTIYKEGDFLGLSGAYEAGWLTKQDVRDLQLNFNARQVF